MTNIDNLECELRRIFLQSMRLSPDPKEMVRIRKQVEYDHGSATIVLNKQTIGKVVAQFNETGVISSFRELRYICAGFQDVLQKGDENRSQYVFDSINQQTEFRKKLRCFQGLLMSYWNFPREDKIDYENFNKLRIWLGNKLGKLLKNKEYMPPWLNELKKHKDDLLFFTMPCKNFGKQLLQGNDTIFKEVTLTLAIPQNSWVQKESIFSQIRAASESDDGEFKGYLSKLLKIATYTVYSDILKKRCIAELVKRYARCADKQENADLRDAAVSIIGNPWLERSKWDAWVKNEKGEPHNKARELINGWLKRRLITDFFELLSTDDLADSRRLNYWLKFEHIIKDMWFVLGRNAAYSMKPQLKEFKKRAKGRLLYLDGASQNDNAFVMEIDDYLMVEFGLKGNATFIYQSRLNLFNGENRIYINSLKDKEMCEIRLTHQKFEWECHYDDCLLNLGVNFDV